MILTCSLLSMSFQSCIWTNSERVQILKRLARNIAQRDHFCQFFFQNCMNNFFGDVCSSSMFFCIWSCNIFSPLHINTNLTLSYMKYCIVAGSPKTFWQSFPHIWPGWCCTSMLYYMTLKVIHLVSCQSPLQLFHNFHSLGSMYLSWHSNVFCHAMRLIFI